VGLKELPISLRELGKSPKELYNSPKELCISFPEICISLEEIHISLADLCISPEETQSAAAKSGDVSSARGKQKRRSDGSGAASSRVQPPQGAVAD